MKTISTLLLTTTLTGLLYANGNHIGDHMHNGKMMNHANPNGMTNEQMRKMEHKNHHSMHHTSNDAFFESLSSGDYQLTLSSKKPLVVGNNSLLVTIKQDNRVIDNVKVKIKVFMPEMPGMPYMEFKDNAKKADTGYEMNVNFSMNGTWQYQLKFKMEGEKKVHTIRGSFNL